MPTDLDRGGLNNITTRINYGPTTGWFNTHTLGFSTVALLPAASDAFGSRQMVVDSTVAAAGNFGAIVAGGGLNIVPVYSDDTNWRIG